MKHPTISVVIPVKNESTNIRRCLDGILSQTVDVMDIVVVDSGSTDGTLEILNEYDKVKTVKIDPSEFNHGLTRNLGVQHTKGELVVLTVGDARPADDQWLEKMVRHFKDPEVAGVCGQQVVPHEKDKNPHQWFRPQHPPGARKYQFNSPAEFKNLSPGEKYTICRWDDVTAVYRKKILNLIPFHQVTYGEDMVWAKEALSRGFKIVYDTSALVYHYHDTNFAFQYKRTLTVLYHVYKYFDFIKPNPFNASYPFRVIYRNFRYRAEMRWIGYNLIRMAATVRAHRHIRKWELKGKEYLDDMHNRICGIAPQPEKQASTV